MDEQHFCPDNSGYAEKRVQSYDFFPYLANFQAFYWLFNMYFFVLLRICSNFAPINDLKDDYDEETFI